MPAEINILLKTYVLLEKRLWKWTVCEIMIIIVFYTVIVVNPAVKSKNYILQLEEAQRTQFYENRTSLYDISAFLRLQGMQVNRLRLGLIYAPVTPFTTRAVLATQKALQLHHAFGVENERILLSNFNGNTFLAGVVFHNVSSIGSHGTTVPEKLSVTLFFPSEFRTSNHPIIMHRLWLTRCTGVLDDYDSDRMMHVDLYLREGFLQLQHRLFMEWIKVLQGHEESVNDGAKVPTDPTLGGLIPAISIQSFRHHTNHEPCQADSSSNIIWFLYYFTFLVPFLRLIMQLAKEREDNIPAHHWIYGYERGHHWWAHFLISFLHLMVLVSIIALFVTIEWSTIKKYHIFRHVNPGLFLLFHIVYVTLLIAYAMIVTALFANTTNCMLFGLVMWLGSYGLFSIILDNTEELTTPVIICMLMFFNNFYPFGMKLMKFVESEPDNDLLWRLICTESANLLVLLFALSVVDFIRPGRYIRRLYYNFLCIPYCCCYPKKSDGNRERSRRPTMVTLDGPSASWQHFEYGPVVGKEVLHLKNIITYVDHTQVRQQLKKITMRFFKNEIAVILGGHSTGKTRLITMMAGWQKPHVGRIYYNGEYDIYENWLDYRRNVDVSMPNNALYDLLTVRESIRLICEMKYDPEDLNRLASEVNKWLGVLKLFIPDTDNVLVSELSFSQQRLVALCCALSGNTKIVLLDEPTNHMTFEERTYYWEVLRREKQNRAIILTTYAFDEADAVGDRIGIMNEGRLMAWGTPFFLKTRLGMGFDLIILKDLNAPSSPISELINRFMTDIRPNSEIGEQLIYKLPKDQRHLYQRMFIHLEKHSKELGISQLVMRGSELSEVYMTLGLQDSSDQPQLQEVSEFAKLVEVAPTKDLRRHHINAMLYKKMIYQAPNIIPIIMIFAVFLLILLINELTKCINVPSSINNGIQLGMPMAATSRAFLNGSQDCSYVEINETETYPIQRKLNNKPKYFLFKQFHCGRNSYREDVLRDPAMYDKLGAVEWAVKGKHMILWIHERIFHTAALSMNLAHNLILRDLYPNNPQRLATIVNKPMIIPLHVKINLIDNQISHLRLPLTLGIIMPITMSCFIVSLVEERYSHLMTLQRLAGVSMDIFWIVGVLWDYGTFFAFSLIYFLVMLAATIEGFGMLAKLLTFVLLNVHGISALCGIYLMSLFMPDSKYRAFLISIVVQFGVGLCAYIFYWDVVENNRLYFYILSLSPTFSLLDGIGNLYTETKEQEYCRERCEIITDCNTNNMCALIPNCCNDKFFKWSPPGILPSLAFMTLSAILSSVAFFCVNLYRREKLHTTTPRIKQMATICYPRDDKDVVTERIRIANLRLGECKKYSIVVDQMENRIPSHGKRLNTISFAVEPYKSLGFYGGHNSGKSHLLQQLVGDRSFRFGEMFICGKDAKYEQDEAYNYMSYCPQERGLCDAFTPRQLFTLLFMIRGIPKAAASTRIREISKSLNLRKYMSKRIAFLSSTVKRQLNIGLSLIAHSKVLILDEPTRGMAALERRQIWQLLRQERDNGVSIVFSSSDMLECEMLADDIAVIDNGEMLARGSPQYVRAKYVKGIYLEVKITLDGSTKEETESNLEKDVENMLMYVKFLHEDSKLIKRSESILKYYFPIENIRYSYLFGSLKKNRRRLNINDYTIGVGTQLEALGKILATREHRDAYKKFRKSKLDGKSRKEGGSDYMDDEGNMPDTKEETTTVRLSTADRDDAIKQLEEDDFAQSLRDEHTENSDIVGLNETEGDQISI